MSAAGTWVAVSDTELNAIWDEARRLNEMFNGCTNAALVRRYGRDNVRHDMGVGWFKREAPAEMISLTEAERRNAVDAPFKNAIAIYRSPDDVELSLAEQFRVIADRIEEDRSDA